MVTTVLDLLKMFDAVPVTQSRRLMAMRALAGCELSLSSSDELWCEQSLKVSDQFNSLSSRGRQ
jgi:hypothetical protein